MNSLDDWGESSVEIERLSALVCQSRDSAAMAAYLTAIGPALSRFVRGMSGKRLLSVIEVDDLVQEVAVSALAGLSSAPLDAYTPWQWCQQLARRRVIDAHRHHFGAQRRDASRDRSMHAVGDDDASNGFESMLVASLTSASAVLSRDVRLSRLNAAIAALPASQRDVVVMRYVEGQPTKQIAERLGKTDVAIRVMLSRCMRSLEAELADVRPTR